MVMHSVNEMTAGPSALNNKARTAQSLASSGLRMPSCFPDWPAPQ